MPCVLPLDVMKRAVGVSLVVERADARSLEARAEAELPAESGLYIERECTCDHGVRRQYRVNVIVGRSESQQASPLALQENDACEDSPRGCGGRDRSIVFEPKHHVKTERREMMGMIPTGTMKTIVGLGIMGRTIGRRRNAHLGTFGELSAAFAGMLCGL